MTITFDFVQDFRKYRDYLTYVTKVDEVIGKLPFSFYQGDMLDCYVIQKNEDVVTVTMSNNTDELQERFIKDAQGDTFNSIPDGVAYMYDVNAHELIYNFDTKESSSLWRWSTYPEVFWLGEDQSYDHGLALGADGKPCRLYLSNTRLTSLFVALTDLNRSFPSLFSKNKTQVTLEPAGVNVALAIIAAQLGQDEPKMNDVKTAISCDLVNPDGLDYAKYDVKDVIELFEMKGNEDDLWEDTWGAALGNAVAADDMRDQHSSSLSQTTYTNQICISDLAPMSEVPICDRICYVHMDIPINGIHYMLIEPDQTLHVFFDDLIITPDEIYQALENLPQSQIQLIGDYEEVTDDELADMDRSGATLGVLEDEFDNLEDGSVEASEHKYDNFDNFENGGTQA